MKEFRAIFSISSILVIRSGYAIKDHISILAVIQKIWDLHKFGLQFEFRTQISSILSSGPGMQKRIISQY